MGAITCLLWTLSALAKHRYKPCLLYKNVHARKGKESQIGKNQTTKKRRKKCPKKNMTNLAPNHQKRNK